MTDKCSNGSDDESSESSERGGRRLGRIRKIFGRKRDEEDEEEKEWYRGFQTDFWFGVRFVKFDHRDEYNAFLITLNQMGLQPHLPKDGDLLEGSLETAVFEAYSKATSGIPNRSIALEDPTNRHPAPQPKWKFWKRNSSESAERIESGWEEPGPASDPANPEEQRKKRRKALRRFLGGEDHSFEKPLKPVNIGVSDNYASLFFCIPLGLACLIVFMGFNAWGVYDVLKGYGYGGAWTWGGLGQFCYGTLKFVFGVIGIFSVIFKSVRTAHIAGICIKTYVLSSGVQIVTQAVEHIFLALGWGADDPAALQPFRQPRLRRSGERQPIRRAPPTWQAPPEWRAQPSWNSPVGWKVPVALPTHVSWSTRAVEQRPRPNDSLLISWPPSPEDKVRIAKDYAILISVFLFCFLWMIGVIESFKSVLVAGGNGFENKAWFQIWQHQDPSEQLESSLPPVIIPLTSIMSPTSPILHSQAISRRFSRQRTQMRSSMSKRSSPSQELDFWS